MNRILLAGFGFCCACLSFSFVNQEVPETTCSDTISFSSVIHPIIKVTCALESCHTSEERRGNFMTFEDVRAVAVSGKLMKKILKEKMPPSDTKGPKKLSAEQIALIRCWVEQGAVNN